MAEGAKKEREKNVREGKEWEGKYRRKVGGLN